MRLSITSIIFSVLLIFSLWTLTDAGRIPGKKKPECCIATNKPCDITNPGACCSQTCGVKPNIGPDYYCY